MRAGFALHYRIEELVRNERMLMAVDSRFFTAREEILFEATDTGTRLRYIARFSFPAALSALNKLYPAAMDRVGKSAMSGLKKALDDDFETPRQSAWLAAADRWVLPGVWRFTKLRLPRVTAALEARLGLPG